MIPSFHHEENGIERTNENQGDVVLVSGAVVPRVSGDTRNQTVLFKTAVNGETVFTGDDAQVIDIGSTILQTNQVNCCQFYYHARKLS